MEAWVPTLQKGFCLAPQRDSTVSAEWLATNYKIQRRPQVCTSTQANCNGSRRNKKPFNCCERMLAQKATCTKKHCCKSAWPDVHAACLGRTKAGRAPGFQIKQSPPCHLAPLEP